MTAHHAVLVSSWTCSNHSTKLIETACARAYDAVGIVEAIFPVLYSMGLLFRMGSYFLRVLVASHNYFATAAIPVRATLSCRSREFSEELGDYILRNYVYTCLRRKKRTKQENLDGRDEMEDAIYGKGDFRFGSSAWDKPGAQKRKLAWAYFTAVFNCLPDIAHVHVDDACCDHHSDDVMRRRMRDACQQLCFSALPDLPSSHRWEKSGPALDYYIRSLVAIPLLGNIWDLAFDAIKTKPVIAGAPEEEQAWLEATEFHVVGSKRIKRGGKMVRNPKTPQVILVIAIVLEPLRWINGWLLYFSSGRIRKKSWGCPPLLNWVNPMYSPPFRVLQYYADMLQGKARRCRLLWLLTGHSDFLHWAHTYPDVWLSLRRSATVAASWVFRRLYLEITYPWTLALVTDQRIPEEHRQRFQSQFIEVPGEYLDERWSAKFRHWLVHLSTISGMMATAERLKAALRWDRVQLFLRRWSWAVRMGTGMVERAHARNRKRSTGDMGWNTFVSNYVLMEHDKPDPGATVGPDEGAPPTAKARPPHAAPKLMRRDNQETATRKKDGYSIFREKYTEVWIRLGVRFGSFL